jgi:hypothetical protein
LKELKQIDDCLDELTKYRDSLGEAVTVRIFDPSFEGNFNYYTYIAEIVEDLSDDDVTPTERLNALKNHFVW